MAFIVLNTGKTVTVDAEKGAAIWAVLEGEVEPENDKQEAFVSNIKRIYLNPDNAPASYLAKNKQGIDINDTWWNK